MTDVALHSFAWLVRGAAQSSHLVAGSLMRLDDLLSLAYQGSGAELRLPARMIVDGYLSQRQE